MRRDRRESAGQNCGKPKQRLAGKAVNGTFIISTFYRLSGKPILWLAAALLFSGCAYRSQVVTLDPNLGPLPKSATTQWEIIVLARDGRSTQEIGRRMGGSNQEVPITAGPNVAEVLKGHVAQIVESKGFRVTDSAVNNPRVLEVELTELSYATVTEGGERKVKIQAGLKTIARNVGTQAKEKIYTARQERRVLMEPVAKSNEEWINETLSDVLKHLAADASLFAFLE
jgi:uncharacterized lipoprotein YajG